MKKLNRRPYLDTTSQKEMATSSKEARCIANTELLKLNPNFNNLQHVMNSMKNKVEIITEGTQLNVEGILSETSKLLSNKNHDDLSKIKSIFIFEDTHSFKVLDLLCEREDLNDEWKQEYLCLLTDSSWISSSLLIHGYICIHLDTLMNSLENKDLVTETIAISIVNRIEDILNYEY